MERFVFAKGLAPWLLAASLLPIGADSRKTPPPVAQGQGRARAEASCLPMLVGIEPGTYIGSGPPEGWTHLVLKSVPRLASGALGSLPRSSAATANLVRTAILAEVRGGRLRRVAIGLCVPDGTCDRVVDPERPESQGIALSRMARLVLSRAGREVDRVRLAAVTPTFAVLDMPAALAVGGRHREVHLQYGLLAGRGEDLVTGLWAIDEESREPTTPDIVVLPPSLVFDCDLDVSANRLLGTFPVSWRFAMRALPPGRTVPFPTPFFLEDDAPAMERALRRGLCVGRGKERAGEGIGIIPRPGGEGRHESAVDLRESDRGNRARRPVRPPASGSLLPVRDE